MGNYTRISSIYKSFDTSMQGLYKLHMATQDSLGKDEWKIMQEYYEDVYSLFEDYDPEEVQLILERMIKIDVEDETLNYRKVWETINIDPRDILKLENDREVAIKEIQDNLKDFARLYPEKANNFFRMYLKTQREEPFKAELSRQGLLLSATSQFEFLITHLLRAHFLHSKYNENLNEDLSYEELDEEITNRVKKNSKFLSMFNKLDFLTKKHPLHQSFAMDELKEISERRNVFAHRSGLADKAYTKFNNKVNIGDRLRISQNYIKRALEDLHLWGLVICVKVWERLEIYEEREMGRVLAATCMQLIRADRNEFCAKLCERVLATISFTSQNNKDTLLINYAIALEKLKQIDDMEKILSRIRLMPPESVPSMGNLSKERPFFHAIPMAVYILKGKYAIAMDMLERAADSGQISYLDLDHWVIFDYVVQEPRFLSIKDKLKDKITIAS